MLDLNNTTRLNGHAGKAPELRKTNSGRDVANFTLATNCSFSLKDKDTGEYINRKEEWHQIVAWGETALYCHRNLRKGSAVQLVAHAVTRKWMKTVEQDGTKFQVETYTTEYHVDEIDIRNKSKDSASNDTARIEDQAKGQTKGKAKAA